MWRPFSFLACLMLVLMLWTGTAAHAAETLLPIAEPSGINWEHAHGDADEVPADADKASPHHHGLCHGHDFRVPPGYSPAAPIVAANLPGFPPVHALSPVQADKALRPPIA
jgi:hypothetical protein